MNQPQITGFEIIERVGTGGMASVWKARQLSLDRIVAIKVLSTTLAQDIDDITRFLKEAKSAAKLKHPGIIQVYDVNAEEGLYYIVMEYVAGYTVGEWLRRKEVLSEQDAILVVDCVADALDYAWSKEGIIHCDIKPDNIIIDSDGTVKVADLGLARTISAMSSSQEDEFVMGTPAYMSPEQARGIGNLDCRADIYSLGAMLYHLVTGKVLFDGQDDSTMMELQTSDATVGDPFDINPKLSKSLCWLIEKMLAKERANRHGNWAAVRADISRVKKGRMPAGGVLPEGCSAVARSNQRTAQDYALPTVTTSRSAARYVPERMHFISAAVLLIFVFIGLAGLLYIKAHKAQPGVASIRPVASVQPVQAVDQTLDKAASEMFEFAKKWAGEHEGSYSEAVARFEKVEKDTAGTKYSLMAADEIQKLNQARKGACDKELGRLAESIKPLLQNREFDKAAELVEKYSGKLARETLIKRHDLVKTILAKKREMEKADKDAEKLAEQKMDELMCSVAASLVSAGLVKAHDEVVERSKDQALALKRKELDEVARLLEDSMGLDNKIIDSFSTQKKQEITVNLTGGPVTVTINEISAGKVDCIQRMAGGGVIALSFDASSLSSFEKLKRLGPDSNQEVALVKGLIAMSARACGHAKRYFSRINPLLGAKLIALAEADEKKTAE